MKILEILTEKRLTGNKGEREAARFLKKQGYKILKRNYVGTDSEIDIIAKNNQTLVFVEVKTRHLSAIDPKEPRPASAVNPQKQRKIISCASQYKRRFGDGYRMRFDIIEVYLDNSSGKDRLHDIKHLIGAFDMNTAYAKH
ncbi:MAG: YraN family protein [Clostridia bacterium]|nr:YraN family protein [Clostridia bacterium]